MIQCGSYKDAKLEAINLLSNWENQIAKIELIEKDEVWWIKYEILEERERKG